MSEHLFSLKDHSSRSAIIDAWRGIAMLMVLVQHNGAGDVVGNLILQFHMPLFFIISGFMLDRSGSLFRYSPGGYISKRFIQLIIPYLCFELVLLTRHLVYAGAEVNISETLLSIATVHNTPDAAGLRLWFLPCLFMADSVAFLFLRQVKSKTFALFFALTTYGAAWGLSMMHPQRLPFTLDIGMVALTFIILGYVLASCIRQLEIRQLTKNCRIGLFILITICFYCSQNNEPFLMYIHSYGNYFMAFIGATCGSLATLIAVPYTIAPLKWKWVMTFVTWAGRNSLLLYPLHILILNELTLVGQYIEIPTVLRLFALIILCIPSANLINKYLPFLAGRGFARQSKAVPEKHGLIS